MKRVLLGLAVAISAWSAGSAMADEGPLMAPIHQFVDAFNKGDDKAAAKAFAPGSIDIIDEVPPHAWSGTSALQHWAKALEAASKAGGLTDEGVSLGDATRQDVNGGVGYVVVAATFTYKEMGKPMREPAQMVYSLKKLSGHWLITGWTWVGGKEEPAG
jgi:hypothetical protein